MAKKTINAVCDSIQINKNNSIARFVIEVKGTAAGAAGVRERLARTVVTAAFDTPDGVKDFQVGKDTEITFSQK